MSDELIGKDLCETKHKNLDEWKDRAENSFETLFKASSGHERRISHLEGKGFSNTFWASLIGSGLVTIAAGLIMFALLRAGTP